MKSYMVRITPLIMEDWAAFLRHSAMFAGLSTGLFRVRASPWVVEAQVVAAVPHWLSGRGQPGVAGNKKDTSPLRRGV